MVNKNILNIMKRNIHLNTPHSDYVARNPGLTAKRIIKCVGDRLREIDPSRWNSTPITFKTKFTDDEGLACVRTSINIHDALEQEFGISIKDRHILV